QSASSCPACKKHLKFEPGAAANPAPSFSALALEGAVKHPNVGQAWESSVLVSIKNEKGEEVARQVVNVGALEPGEQRSFAFSVDVFVPETKAAAPEMTDSAVKSAPPPPPGVAAAGSPGAPSVPSGTRPGMPPATTGTRPAAPPVPPPAPPTRPRPPRPPPPPTPT